MDIQDKHPLVIFRVVARNSEKTIVRTIESILAQTYTYWELHLVNNGSTDSTGEIMEQFTQKDPRIKVFTNEGNYVWKNGNKFYDYYKKYNLDNTFLCYLDGDDEYKPDFLEKMVAFAEENNLDIACCGYDRISAGENRLLDSQVADSIILVEDEGFSTLFPQYYVFMRTRWGKLFRLTVTDKVRVSDNFDMIYGGDTAESLEYFRYALRAGIYNNALHRYYVNHGSITYKWHYERILSDRILFDIAHDYLLCKAGHISAENEEHLMTVYLAAVNATTRVLLHAQIPVFEKLSGLRDIFSSRHTRDMVIYPIKNSEMRKTLFKDVADWIAIHEGEFYDNDSKAAAKKILSTLPVISGDGTDIMTVVRWVLREENAGSVLEISGFGTRCGKMMQGMDIKTDRIDLTDSGTLGGSSVYENVFGSQMLSDIGNMERYDVILVFHLLENTAVDTAKIIVEALLEKADKQVLVITPEYPYDLESADENKLSDVRAYHPVFFLGMDFSYKMFATLEGRIQAYSLFPKTAYKPLPCDKLPGEYSKDKKLKIAYVICNHAATGGMKALYRQMKILAGRGHSISAYYRSDTAKGAIPGWCSLTEKDVPRQVVVPADEDILNYIGDEDIIILTWLKMAEEFANAEIPVALWEQGSPLFFGEYNSLASSSSWTRTQVHGLYRKPVHLLAVSEIVQKALKEVYNRSAQYFPVDIDTDLYHPKDSKNNEIPVVLFVGYPLKEHKGFHLAYKVLEAAHQIGIRFKAQVVSQADFILGEEPSFELEKIIDPAQDELAQIYKNADVFLLTSLYESLSLPPLEAMASGTAVIAMDCGGINAYAEPGENMLLCDQGDTFSMLYALQHLLQNPGAREELALRGRETALRFSFSEVVAQWENCLYKIISK